MPSPLPRLARSASVLALLALITSTTHAVDYYKANNTTTLTNVASWWFDAAGTVPATTAPVNSANPAADVFIWNNLLAAAQTFNVPDVGLHTIRILNPGGPITLDGVNGRTITTGATGGGIDMSQATQDLTLLNCFLRIPATGNTVGIQVATGRTLTFGTTAQVNVRNSAGGTTLNVNTDGLSTGTVTFAANVAANNFTVGAGHVELNSPTGNARNNASNSSTTIGGGPNPARLLINNISGSATGLPNPNATPTPITSTVTINANGTLGGNGISASAVTANAGSILSPGRSSINSGIGTLSVASLTLGTDSSILYEGNNITDADLLAVTASNGLTINGGTVFLYNPGTTDPLTATGTFKLINFSGAIGGTGLGALTIAESTKIAGRNYTLGLGATGVTLTITTGTTIQRSWDVDASGNWSTAANWTDDTVPDAVGTIANIAGAGGATFTAPHTVTLDSDRTVGALNLDSIQAVTLAGSGAATLTLNNDLAAATLNATGANHIVSTPLALTAGGALATVDSAQLTLAGAISGTGVGIVKTGAGTLLLTANNPYTGATSISTGVVQIGDGGTTGSVGGPIANSGTLRINRSDALALAFPISGTGSVEFLGAGGTTLEAANTYSGPTTLAAGSLVLANTLALQNTTLTYSTTGGGLTVADPVTAITLGGLAGNRALPLTNSLGTQLALTVGQNNVPTIYSGSPLGTGASFTKTGSGSLTLTGNHAYSGNTLVNAGTLSIDTGSTFNTAAASLGTGPTAITARILVNGGTLNSTAASTLTNASAGIAVTAGVANFTSITGDANSSAGASFISVTGVGNTFGTLNAASISLSRGALSITSEPTSGQTGAGLYVNGGVANITGALNLGAASGANSSVSSRIDGGSLTVNGPVTVGINNIGRWSVLDLNGGVFTSTDATTGVQLGSAFDGNVVMLVRGGTTVANAQRIQFGQSTFAGTAKINLLGGALYVGSGGLVLGSSNPAFVGRVSVAGGKLGATADWSSTLPFTFTGGSFTGSDANDVPHTITLYGALTSTGGLVKNGSGTVIFTSPSTTVSLATTVAAGTLGIGGLIEDITVAAGATLAPQGELVASFGATIEGTLAIRYDSTAPIPVPRLVATPLTLGAASTLTISGTGNLPGPAYVIAKASTGISGTFATVTGLPAGFTLDYAYDDDSDAGTPPAIAIVGSGVVVSPYEVWTNSFSLVGADALPSADPDQDGLVNLLEYALTNSPVVSDAPAAYTLGRDGNFLTLGFDHPADASLTYQIEATNDLAAGWGLVHTFAPFTVTGSGIYTDTADLTVTPRRFLRLKVTPAP